ncbi:MAG: segregation/condensation protein A [Candidatus ainarchaeum sp.]|nr:segregation/condensation protein A [Candidatus ainarchaeum sp.]
MKNKIDSIEIIDKSLNIEENMPTENAYERDYSQMDLVDLIDQPAWKTILIDLVSKEKMDPWNIDVCLLTQKYLEKINQLESKCLRVPANAILACAILVKTKSKYLKLSSIEEDEKEEEINPEKLQLELEELPDLVANRQFREGKITLDELVASIEDIIHKTNPKKSNTRNIPRMELNFDTVNIEDKMDEVYTLIKNKVDSQGIVLFDNLIENNESDTLVNTFLPVLFLMNNQKLIAYQEEFFGTIFIKLNEELAKLQETI